MKTYQEFTAADWERIRRDWSAWWTGELDRPLVHVVTYDPGVTGGASDGHLTRFPLEMPAGQVLDQCEPLLAATHYHGDAFPHWWPNLGAGIMAGFLGSGVHYASETGTTWFAPLDGLDSLADLDLRYDPSTPWWRRVQDLTRAAVARWGGRVVIGHTDLGGNLDILAALRGTERLLLDLVDAPGEIERLTRTITDLWLRYYAELRDLIAPAQAGFSYWAGFWSPGTGYMLQSDFCYMISPRMFRRYVLPDLAACCAALDYAFYHMDGKGQLAHLDMLLGIERLRGIQWQPGAGQPLGSEWPDVLRRIRDGGKLCQVYVDRAGAFKIMRELGGRGFLFIIDSDERLTPGEADDFVNELLAR